MPDAHADSPLLGPLLDDLSELFEAEVLKQWLNPTDLALLARVGRGCRDAVRSSGMPIAGVKGGACPLEVKDFVGSLELLAWAKASGCPWNERTCALAAARGHLVVLKWAREHHCPVDEWTCAYAAWGGHLEVLTWAREHDCPWDAVTCSWAAARGHLEALTWARAHHCPWDEMTCAYAAMGGHL